MSFPSPLSQRHRGDGAPIVAASAPAAELPGLATGPVVRPTPGRRALPWLFAVLALVLLGVVAYFLTALGPGAAFVGLIVALAPLAVVIVAVRMVDRWEPEPRGLLVLAFAWGAVAAVAIALVADLALDRVFGSDGAVRDAVRTVLQAPVVEELAKGLGVLLIFAAACRAFDGPVDGVVYGALIGGGFAFTENIQYFAVSFLDGGLPEVSTTFLLRGILSPFAHVMFTSVTGFAVGIAARRGASVREAAGPWLLGMLGAACLHALWNVSAMFGDFFALYATLQVPLFVLFVVGVLGLRREEQRLTRARLSDYADAGWFTPDEVQMLATARGRRAAYAWAHTLRGDRTSIMRAFITDATALAAARQRVLTGRDPEAAAEAAALLARTAAARRALFAA